MFSRPNANIVPTVTMELDKHPPVKFYRDYTSADLKNAKKQPCKSHSEAGDCTTNVPINDENYGLEFGINQITRSFREAVEALNFTASQLYTNFPYCLSAIDLDS